MSLSPEFRSLLAQLRLQPPSPDPSIEELRAGASLGTGMVPLPPDVYWEGCRAGRVRGEWVTTLGADDDRALLYLHGGAWVAGSPPGYRELASRLSRGAAARVLVIDYRLAPEHPFPAALEDAYEAYRWLLGEGFDPGQTAIVGDSAGGGLALSTLVSLRDATQPLPAAAVLLSPWVDLGGPEPILPDRAGIDPVLHPGLLQKCAAAYLGDMDPRAPLASPLYASLENLPPLLVHVGTAEILHDQAVAVVARARQAGVRVTFEPWPEMIHVWHLFAALIPEGRQALARVTAFLSEHLGRR